MMADRITAVLTQHGPLTAAQIAKLIPDSRTALSVCIGRMRRRDELHVADWAVKPPGTHGRGAPIYKLGAFPSMPEPRKPTYKVKPKRPVITPAMRQEAGMWGALMR